MLQPNKNKRKIYTPIISKNVSNIDKKNFVDILNFENKYINTPKFKERVEKAGYDYKDYFKNQKNILTTVKLLDNENIEGNVAAFYNRDNNTVNIPPEKNNMNYYNEIVPTSINTLSHELGHSYNNGNLLSFINKRNKLLPDNKEEQNKILDRLRNDYTYYSGEGHEYEPNEVAADVHAARYELYNYGINNNKNVYDGRYSNFTNDAYNQMKEIAKNVPSSASARVLNKIGTNKYNDIIKAVSEKAENIKTEKEQEKFDEVFNGIHKRKKYDTKKNVFDIMNRVVSNKKLPTVSYAAYGGRLPSKQRHIWGAVIGAGVSLLTNAITKDKNEAAQRQQILEQERAMIKNQLSEKTQNDAIALRNYMSSGDDTVNYYGKGGKLNKLPSIGGYKAKGGNLIPIANGVEQVIGNRHNETTIDGVSGVQLSQDGEPIAEVEDNEVIVDGNQVLSDRLKYDKNNTYADKMRTLAKKRNNLESQQERLNNKRTKNTIERKLAGLNAAEDALFKQQEIHKLIEGKNVLDNLNTFAYGGSIFDPPIKRNFMFPRVANGKYKDWFKSPNGYINPNNPKIMVDEQGNPVYDYDKSSTNNYSSTPVNTSSIVDNSTPTTTNSIVPVNTSPVVGAKVPENSETGNDNNFWNSSTGEGIKSAIPGVISGLGAIAMAKSTPKLPRPLLNTSIPLETRINVNPQIANIRGSVKATVDNVLGNTSNSNNAKANILSARLRGASEINNILGNKQNQEIGLINADNQNKQMINNANTATINQYNMNNYQRLNDIRTMKSAGFNQIIGAVQNGLNVKKTADNFDAYTRANLMDDDLGEKLDLYLKDPEFMRNPDNVKFINSILKNRRK